MTRIRKAEVTNGVQSHRQALDLPELFAGIGTEQEYLATEEACESPTEHSTIRLDPQKEKKAIAPILPTKGDKALTISQSYWLDDCYGFRLLFGVCAPFNRSCVDHTAMDVTP